MLCIQVGNVCLGCLVSADSAQPVTELLVKWKGGDQEALQALLPLVYDELRRLAQHYLRAERPDHTLRGTELVHEAYLRLVDQQPGQLQTRSQFFGVAARLMREILVDHARSGRALKRDYRMKLTLDEAVEVPQKREFDLLALDDALNELSRFDAQQARIVELRFFGGLSIEETSEILRVSPATVKRDWATARAWLYREISRVTPG